MTKLKTKMNTMKCTSHPTMKKTKFMLVTKCVNYFKNPN
jgi:hypothetical protein